ncbi:MAG: response regulator [Chloroflexota bacterium]|nr:response regulator [Chloroflexota bacterium]
MSEGRILIVDDESNIVRPCVKALIARGYEAQGASNGQEALALLERESFDLLLLDLKMPGMDGLEVLRQAKDMRPGVEAIIVSGHGTLELAAEAMRLGALDFMTKPIDLEHIIAKVQQTLEHTSKPDARVRGNLRSMSLTSIVSINCNEHNQARLRLRHHGQEVCIFFADGNIVHAVSGSQIGEEVVYELLTWEDGEFELEMDVPPPEQTITVGWSGLLLEGMHRIDEQQTDAGQQHCPECGAFLDTQGRCHNPSCPRLTGDAAGWDGLDVLEEQAKPKHEEVSKMATKKRSQVLAEHLETLLAESGDINGAAIVGHDGLILASNLALGGHDATRVGAEGAALLGLSKRTLGNLKCGDFEAAILEGKDGWIITMGAGAKAMVLGLTNADVNLGMAMIEMRDIAEDVAGVMS